MADPTIQTFCCRHSNNTSLVVIQELNTEMYNNVCMISSIIGILGSIYQILPREITIYQYRWQSFSAFRSRDIIVWLAIADFFASLGVFVRSIVWINYETIVPTIDDTFAILFCVISSVWTQYFYMATWIWTLCYAIDMKFLLSEKAGKPVCYHIFAWVCPGILTIIGLSILYFPDANCHESVNLTTAILRILPNYFATYGLMTIVMIINPIIYVLSTNNLHNVVTSSAGQLTGRERKLFYTMKLKFSLINIVYWICWLPNLINGILLWTLWFNLPVKIIIILWYTMAIMNPLQAFFNALVYKSWGKRQKLSILLKNIFFFYKKNDNLTEMNEVSPLLTTKSSINNSLSS